MRSPRSTPAAAPPTPRAPLDIVAVLLRGTLGLLLLNVVVSAVYVLRVADGHAVGAQSLLLAKPALLAVAAFVLVALHRLLARPGRWYVAAATVVAWLALVLAWTGPVWWLELWILPWVQLDLVLPLAIAIAISLGLTLYARRGPGGRRLGAAAQVGLVAALTGLVVGLVPYPEIDPAMNHHGLVCVAPGTDVTLDLSGVAAKDGYPPCHFSFNSLGYRDIEPPPVTEGRTRVLVVGDSYVWGDGIPTNEETLPYRLRDALEGAAPGRFDVMSAAYTGIGLYGYVRFVAALQPALQADIVVVGLLGSADFDPLDAQYRSERLPAPGLARNLIHYFGVPAQVYEASNEYADAFWHGPGALERFRALFDELERGAREGGYRVVVLDYGVAPVPPVVGLSRFERIELPQALRYPGHGNDYWYGRDYHPKPKLNHALAERLTRVLVDDTRTAGAHRTVGAAPAALAADRDR